MAEWFGETAYVVDGRLADFLWVVLIASLSKQLLDKIGKLAGDLVP